VPSFGFVGCYWDLKIRAWRGEPLSPEALAFIGIDEHPRRPSNGWRSPGGPVYEDDREELSAEDSAMLSALMNVPRQDQLEFVNADWF
jgi:hypothetical protein